MFELFFTKKKKKKKLRIELNFYYLKEGSKK